MCREDIRIARQKYTSVTLVTVPGGTSVRLAGPANNRVHITFLIAGTTGTVRPADIADGLTFGMGMEAKYPKADFDIEKHGQVVMKPWRGTADVADALFTVIETFFDDGVYP